MTELTEREFSKHLKSKFNLNLDGRHVQLELSEVKAYLPQHEPQGLERLLRSSRSHLKIYETRLKFADND